jgi:Repeat of unknown function (DUF346)
MIRVVNMIPRSLSGETNQDSEPNLAVNPAYWRQMAASAFTPNPAGGATAPIYVSTDGGATWLLNPILPSAVETADITLRFGTWSNDLYAGILRRPAIDLAVLRTTNPTTATVMTVLESRPSVDQPYVEARTDLAGGRHDRVFIGMNDFASPGGHTATMDVSGTAETAPPSGFPNSQRLETRATSGQDGPSIRPAWHLDGTVYGAFFRWAPDGTRDVVVVRDDANGTGGFAALKDPSDGLAGRRVATGLNIPFENFTHTDFGQERQGSNLSCAVDPANSSRVYVAWADKAGTTYTLHVRRSTDGGATWSADIRTVPNATNPALAMNQDGVLGFLYQEVAGAGGPLAAQRWVTHFLRTVTDFAATDDQVLATVPAATPALQFLPYVGDYIHLLAIGRDFFGVFSANNTPNNTNFPRGVTYQRNANFATGQLLAVDNTTPVAASIDPFFFQSTGQTAIAPVSWEAGRLDAFVVGTDGALYHKWWQGAWGPSVTGYEFLGGVIVGKPTPVSWEQDRLDVFVVGTDRALYHKWWQGAWGPSVTGYEDLGGIIIGNPKVVSWAPDRLDVFVVGTDRALYHKWWDGHAWGPSVTGYENLGGIIVGDPAVVSWGPDRLDVFVVGTDGALYHKWWDGHAWGPSVTGYESLGGIVVGNPTVVSWGGDRLDVFVVGTDRALYHKWWDGQAWGPSVTGYESLGGIIAGDPAPVSWGGDRLDVFVVGTDRALYHKWWDGHAWGPSVTGYENQGGVVIGDPAPVSWTGDRLDVFVEGTDRALYHKWWDGNAWGPSLTGYEGLGGIIDF